MFYFLFRLTKEGENVPRWKWVFVLSLGFGCALSDKWVVGSAHF